MSWTSDHDECENGCGNIMSEDHYVEGRYGHYCSEKCKIEASPPIDVDDREDFHSDG